METDEVPDAELLRRAQADPRRFDALFDRYFDAVYRFVYHQVGRDPHASADLAQDTFLRALRALPSYQEQGQPLRSWLFQIAINLVRDRARRIPPPIPPPRDAAPGRPEHALAPWVQELPELQRFVVLLKTVSGYTDREAADLLGRSEGAVKALYVRALNNLRKRVLP